MKRTITAIFTIMIALVMVMSLAACGDSKEDTNSTVSKLDAENAIVETPKHIYDDAKENLAKVMQNTYIMECRVEKVSSDYFISKGLHICLPIDELAKLNTFDTIAIIGKVTDEDGASFVVGDAELYNGDVPEVAPRKDETYSGRIELLGSGNARVILNNGVKSQVYFAKGEDTSSLQQYSSITFSCLDRDLNTYYDAKLISVENN